MTVSLECVCGKRLNAPRQNTGERVKCPDCNAELTVPVDDNKSGFTTNSQHTFGRFRITECNGQLVITQLSRASGCLGAFVGVSIAVVTLFALVYVFQDVQPIWVGIAGVIGVCLIGVLFRKKKYTFTRDTISADDGLLRSHERVIVTTEQVEEVVSEEKQDYAESITKTTYAVYLQTGDGEALQLFDDFRRSEDGLYLQGRISQFLAIPDRVSRTIVLERFRDDGAWPRITRRLCAGLSCAALLIVVVACLSIAILEKPQLAVFENLLTKALNGEPEVPGKRSLPVPPPAISETVSSQRKKHAPMPLPVAEMTADPNPEKADDDTAVGETTGDTDNGFTHWMRIPELQRRKHTLISKDLWVATIEGRWNEDGPEFRIREKSIPEGDFTWHFWRDLDRSLFDQKRQQHITDGFRLVFSQHYTEPNGTERYQAVFTRHGKLDASIAGAKSVSATEMTTDSKPEPVVADKNTDAASEALDDGFTPWMKFSELRLREPTWNRNRLWFTALEGRWHNGGTEYRARLETKPPTVKSWYWWCGMPQDMIEQQKREHLPDGCRLVFSQEFMIADGSIVHQVIYAKYREQDGRMPDDHFVNPITEGADPWVIRDVHRKRYLWCRSEERTILICTSQQLTSIGDKHVVWRAHEAGPVSQQLWAPEAHFLQGCWHIYFSASDGREDNRLTYVLRSASDDPLGSYDLVGALATGDGEDGSSPNLWAAGMTVFEHDGRLFALWHGWDKPEGRETFLYIAPMNSPTEIGTSRVRLCANDEYLWERIEPNPTARGYNGQPQVLETGHRTFVVFTCGSPQRSTSKLGLLELTSDDPLDPAGWMKHEEPVFVGTRETPGVGRSCFVRSPDGSQLWHVFHAKRDPRPGPRWDLFVQPMKISESGLPVFGTPVAPGTLLPCPAGDWTTTEPSR